MNTKPRPTVVPAADDVSILMTPFSDQLAERSIDGRWPPIDEPIPSSVPSGSTQARKGPVSVSPTSRDSALPLGVSKKLWRTPLNVREFASQANQVATMVLNGDLDINTARIYSGIARTVAQAMSTEVSRARFLSELPNLSFEDPTDG